MAGIDHRHLRMLRNFGQDDLQRTMDNKQRELLWRVACQQARLPYYPLQEVKAEWKRFVRGQSRESGLAMAAEHDPRYVSIGITYKRIIYASHTSTTKALLRKLLHIFARCFKDYEAFLTEVVKLCPQPIEKPPGIP